MVNVEQLVGIEEGVPPAEHPVIYPLEVIRVLVLKLWSVLKPLKSLSQPLQITGGGGKGVAFKVAAHPIPAPQCLLGIHRQDVAIASQHILRQDGLTAAGGANDQPPLVRGGREVSEVHSPSFIQS